MKIEWCDFTYTMLSIIMYAWHLRRDVLFYHVTEFLPCLLFYHNSLTWFLASQRGDIGPAEWVGNQTKWNSFPSYLKVKSAQVCSRVASKSCSTIAEAEVKQRQTIVERASIWDSEKTIKSNYVSAFPNFTTIVSTAKHPILINEICFVWQNTRIV